MPSIRLIAVFAVACINLYVGRRHRNTHRRVTKLPVGRARPRPCRVLEPLVVREERRIISCRCMRRPACPLLVTAAAMPAAVG